MKPGPRIYAKESQVPKSARKIDALESALTELFFIEHPHIQKGTQDVRALKDFIRSRSGQFVWAYYPWLALAVRIPPEPVYYLLRTARNRNLITDAEQQLFRGSTVGIAGLSVGSAALAALVATGGSKYVKIADPDHIEITNLNRIRAALPHVGQNKTQVAGRAAWEVDPFLEMELWEKGIAKETIQDFMAGKQKLDVFVDEMDNIPLKLLSRTVCRALRIPVVMATDNGDSIIVDIERFDLEPRRPIFHGRISFSDKELANITRDKFVALANEIIDPAYFTQAQQESIMDIGRTLAGVPQLGTAATLAGAAVAYAVRRIVTKQPLPSGRYVVSFEQAFVPAYMNAAQKKKRAQHTKKFVSFFTRA